MDIWMMPMTPIQDLSMPEFWKVGRQRWQLLVWEQLFLTFSHLPGSRRKSKQLTSPQLPCGFVFLLSHSQILTYGAAKFNFFYVGEGGLEPALGIFLNNSKEKHYWGSKTAGHCKKLSFSFTVHYIKPKGFFVERLYIYVVYTCTHNHIPS